MCPAVAEVIPLAGKTLALKELFNQGGFGRFLARRRRHRGDLSSPIEDGGGHRTGCRPHRRDTLG